MMKDGKLTNQEKYVLTQEWSMILSSGLPWMEGLSMMYETIEDRQLKDIIAQIKENYQNFGSLSQALLNMVMFDPYMEKMIYIGEQSGHLDQVMKELTKYYKRQEELDHQIREAITYPFILLTIMFLIVFMMVFKVLPIFQDVLESIHFSFSGNSISLMNLGTVFGQVTLVVSGILYVVFLVFVLAYIFGLKTSTWKSFLSNCPGIKKVYYELAVVQFTYVLSLFISSGYPLENLVSILCDFVEHPVLKKKVENIQSQVENGISFSKAMIEERIYEGSYANLIEIANRTGQEDTVYPQLTNWMQEKVERTISNFINVMEPTIVAILSCIVGVLLLSIMLPLLSLMSTF